MLKTALTAFAIILLTGFYNPSLPSEAQITQKLASKELNLENRQIDRWVNSVFRDNILLNLAYLKGDAKPGQVNWDQVKAPKSFEFKLEPNQTFAYHGQIAPEYKDKVVKTTNANFNGSQGFKSDDFLMGDGVCHLASLIYWASKDAGLDAEAPVNHNFAKINDVPSEYGVAIYNDPTAPSVGEKQNLYVTNNKGKAITFKFEYSEKQVKVTISKKS